MSYSNIESQQEADHAALDRAVSQAEARIVALDPNLQAEVIAERAKAIRDETSKQLNEQRMQMMRRAQEKPGAAGGAPG
jgi:hypothetical protein